MTAYIVTELAGPKVAGRRVSPGETIDLTENEARSEILAGVIALAPIDPVTAEETAPADAADEPKKRR